MNDQPSGLERLAAQAEAEAAPGVEAYAVEAVNKAENRPLYVARERIHPRRVSGTFRRVKWTVMAVTLGIYYLLPWVRWDRGPNAPDQAVLVDFPNRKFYFFFIEIWPQEVYYITGLLILAALALFLVTSVAGRVWCGYTCPQTVWTDLFIAVERWVEGDRNARFRLDKAPWTLDKIRKRLTTHGIWLLISIATGGAWVFYFRDAPTLAVELLTGQAPMVAYLFIGVFALTTYALGGLLREQVCTFMCPWPRIQGAMFDEDSLLVTYRGFRGEPRGPHKKGEPWEGRGDCIDCKLCVAVCPAGIDIRDGPQLECIQCALCIDACNEVMEKVGRPPYLIAYDTYRNLEAEAHGDRVPLRIFRPRTFIYLAMIGVVGAIMLFTLLNRDTLFLNVLRDRTPLFVTLGDGSVRNSYTLKIINREHTDKTYAVTVSGPDGATAEVMGQDDLSVAVPADEIAAKRVFVTAPMPAAESQPLTVTLSDPETGNTVSYDTTFRGPGQ